MGGVGPERVTLVERVVGAFRLRYLQGAVLVSLILTSPLYFTTRYLDKGDIGFALTPIFDNRSVPPEGWVLGVVNFVMYTLIILYPLIATRYVRLRLVQTEPELRPLLSRGDTTIHGHFGGVSRNLPPLGLAILFFLLSSPYSFNALQSGGPAFFVYFLTAWPLTLFVVGSFTWVFVRSLWGVYTLGKEPVTLRTSLDDRMFGAGPFGSLSLSLTLSYVGFLGIGVLLFVTDPFGQFPTPIFAVFVLTLSLGAALFFVPLFSIHGKMVRQKGEESRTLREEKRDLLLTGFRPDDEGGADKYLASLSTVEMREKTLAATATWPFDTSVIGKLVAILLSVAAILLSGYLKAVLPGLH